MESTIKFTLLLTSFFLFFNFSLAAQDTTSTEKAWEIPDEFKTMENPTDPRDRGNIMDGKYIYSKECSSCHGESGMGDGSKASELEGYLGDFSDPAFFEENTDGELFYKIKTGRGDMPSFGEEFRYEEDIWLVIDYIKTLPEQ